MSKPKIKILSEQYVESGIYKQLIEINGKTQQTRYFIKVLRRTPGGKTQRPSRRAFAGKISEARLVKAELEQELERKIEDSNRHTIESFYQKVHRPELETVCNKLTFYNIDAIFKGHIIPTFGSKFLDEVTVGDVNDFFHIHLGDIKATTKRNYRKYFNQLMKSALARRIISINPIDGMRPIKGSFERKETYLSPEQLKVLLEFLIQNKHEWRYHVALIALTGMRINECRALTYADIRWDMDLIHVCRTLDKKNGYKHYTKNYKHRFVPLNLILKTLLLERKEKEKLSDHDFVLPQLRKWVTGEHSKVINDILAFLSYPEMDYYDFRATFTVAMSLAGANPFTISEVLGHQGLETIVHYLRKLGISVKGQTDRLNNLIDPQYLPPVKDMKYRLGDPPSESDPQDEED